jgi:hypothetical protein
MYFWELPPLEGEKLGDFPPFGPFASAGLVVTARTRTTAVKLVNNDFMIDSFAVVQLVG